MPGPHSVKRLADRYKDVMGNLTKRADQLVARLDAIEAKGGDAMAGHAQALDVMEGFVREVEDVTNQLSNGGPPLEDDHYTAPDNNGVVLHTAKPEDGPDANPLTGVVLNK